MAKKTKSSAAQQAAAEAKAPTASETKSAKKTTKEQTGVQVIQLGDLEKLVGKQIAARGLDPNRTVDLINMLDERFYRDSSAAARYNIAQETVDKINEITAVAMIAAFATECCIAKTEFATAMRKSQLDGIKEIASKMGITINEKLLPLPKDGIVNVPSSAVEMSEETKKEIEKEVAAATKTVKNNPVEIENEDELKDSLLQILIKGNGSSNFYDKVVTAINFYRSYLDIQADKSEDKEKRHAEIKSYSNADLLAGIAKLLGNCTFTTKGMASFMFDSVQKSKSPVSAFCTFRNASLNKETGRPRIEDSLVADIVKVLISWYGNSEKSRNNEKIASYKANIAELKKDEKKNAKGIADCENHIKLVEANTASIDNVIACVINPERDVVDNFATDYTNNKAEGYKAARMMGSKILDTYYPGVDAKEIEINSLANNLQQYVGVITNMFRDPLNQLPDYNEANIGEFVKIETPKKA